MPSPEPPAKKVCAFCGAHTSRNRAKEHVLRKSWLKQLGHSKSEIVLERFFAENFLDRKKLAADQVQTGAICKKCNGGWMNDADIAVEDAVLGLARSQAINVRPGLDRDIAFWLFKTAFAFAMTDSPTRRYVSADKMDSLRKGILPSSCIVFVHHAYKERHVGLGSIDGWPGSFANFSISDQSSRFKFGVQYDNAVFGCAYADWPNPTFVLRTGIHEVVYVQGANYRHSIDYDYLQFVGISNSRLNFALAAVGVE